MSHDAPMTGDAKDNRGRQGTDRRRRVGLVLRVLGVALVIVSVVLIGWARYAELRASRVSSEALSTIDDLLPDGSSPAPPQTSTDADGHPLMPALEVDGRSYVGVLEVKAIGLRVPVLSSWARGAADVAPARFSGSDADGSLVIGGRDWAEQFARLDEVAAGDEATFSDMGGGVRRYRVSRVRSGVRLSPSADVAGVSSLAGAGTGVDLALFVDTDALRGYLVISCVAE